MKRLFIREHEFPVAVKTERLLQGNDITIIFYSELFRVR